MKIKTCFSQKPLVYNIYKFIVYKIFIVNKNLHVFVHTKRKCSQKIYVHIFLFVCASCPNQIHTLTLTLGLKGCFRLRFVSNKGKD